MFVPEYILINESLKLKQKSDDDLWQDYIYAIEWHLKYPSIFTKLMRNRACNIWTRSYLSHEALY